MHIACRQLRSQNAVTINRLRAAWHVRSFSSSQHRNDNFSDTAPGAYRANPSPNIQAKNIAILGGGISGLATAFNLTKDIPFSKITIFEQQEKVGGWIDSEIVEVDDGSVLFEWGPRSLRPHLGGNGRAMVQLV